MDSHRSVVTDIHQIPQMWYRPSDNQSASHSKGTYRPAALVECRLSFRSIRAGFQHSDERYYTAWYPTKHVTIDWSTPAVSIKKADEVGGMASSDATYQSANFDFSANYFDEIQ